MIFKLISFISILACLVSAFRHLCSIEDFSVVLKETEVVSHVIVNFHSAPFSHLSSQTTCGKENVELYSCYLNWIRKADQFRSQLI